MRIGTAIAGAASSAILLGLLALACGAGAPDGPSGSSASAVEARLAAKRKELAAGTAPREPVRPRRHSAAPEAREVAAPVPVIEEAIEAEGLQPQPEALADRPIDPLAHLPRRERLTRACYRDTFGAGDPAQFRYLLPREREFCRCMVDAIFSTGVAASLQEALIDDFDAGREQAETVNAAFDLRWQRCRM